MFNKIFDNKSKGNTPALIFLNRKQATKFLGEKSIYISYIVLSLVLLGPLLFSIYINYMVNACNLSWVHGWPEWVPIPITEKLVSYYY